MISTCSTPVSLVLAENARDGCGSFDWEDLDEAVKQTFQGGLRHHAVVLVHETLDVLVASPQLSHCLLVPRNGGVRLTVVDIELLAAEHRARRLPNPRRSREQRGLECTSIAL
jgi:hypothetical protein